MQERFHRAFDKKERFVFGGNRSGKTYSHIADLLWEVTGTHPCYTPIAERDPDSGFWLNIREIWAEKGWGEAPKPSDWPYVPFKRGQTITRWCATDWDIMYNTHLKVFRTLLPERFLLKGNWDDAMSKQWHRMTLSDGLSNRIIEFKTYQQFKNDPYSHDSQTLDRVAFDEEPSEECFNINRLRMSTTGGKTSMSLTLARECEWIPQQILDRQEENPRRFILFMECWDNPFVSREDMEAFLATISDPNERRAREKGVPVYYAGRVFPQYSNDHFIDVPDKFYERYKDAPFTLIIDPHDSKPTAVCGLVWDVGGDEPVVYACYENLIRGSIAEITQQVRVDLAALGFKPDLWLIDRSSKRISQLKDGNFDDTIFDEWRKHLPSLLPVGGAGTYDRRINTMHEHLNVNPMTGEPRFFVLKTCPTLDWQFRNYRYKSRTASGEDRKYETVVKKNDDVLDCACYGVEAEPPRKSLPRSKPLVVGFTGYEQGRVRRVI